MESLVSDKTSYFAIIVAGGSGKRMESPLSKQFMLLWDKPILMHTLINFNHSVYEPKIILVLPSEDVNTWEVLSQSYTFHGSHIICKGGSSRSESVLNGLACLEANFPYYSDQSLVAIHDGVRPLASSVFIDSLFDQALKFGNAIPVLPCRDSVRMINDDSGKSKDLKSYTVNRENLRLVQTPQVFNLKTLNECYRKTAEKDELSLYTDDASIVEGCGIPIHLSEGSFENVKITYPDDLLIAQALMGRK